MGSSQVLTGRVPYLCVVPLYFGTDICQYTVFKTVCATCRPVASRRGAVDITAVVSMGVALPLSLYKLFTKQHQGTLSESQ